MHLIETIRVVAVSLLWVACTRELAPIEPDRAMVGCEVFRATPGLAHVDLLLMIDNSGSMAEEQRLFADQIHGLVSALSTGDVDGDGLRDFRPIESLNVGVVTSDMGTGVFRYVARARRGRSLATTACFTTGAILHFQDVHRRSIRTSSRFDQARILTKSPPIWSASRSWGRRAAVGNSRSNRS